MKRLLLTLGLLLCASPCWGVIALGQACVQKDTSGTSTTLAFGSNVTINHLIVIGVRVGLGTGATITISDTIGNTWTNGAININNTGLQSQQISWAVNKSTAADTLTIMPSSTATIRIALCEWNGTATSNVLDIQADTAQGTSTAPASSSFLPNAPNELVVALTSTNSGETVTAGANYALEEQVPTGANAGRFAFEDWIQTSATATTGNFTLNGSIDWLAGYAVFKASGGAPACAPTLTLLGVGRCG